MIIVNAILHFSSARVFNHLFFFSFPSLSCFIDLLQKISEIIENMIFSLIFVFWKIWYFCQMRKITKIWYLRWAFSQECCFSCSLKHSYSCRVCLKIHSWSVSFYFLRIFIYWIILVFFKILFWVHSNC